MQKVAGIPIVLAPYYGQSQKQRELQNAFARSHAAKISHQRRKSKEEVPAATESSDDSELSEQESSDTDTDNDTSLVPYPRTILIENNGDPFASDPFRKLSPTAARSLEFTYQVLWPANSPAMTPEALDVQVNFWRRTAMESSLSFHTQVAQATSLCYCLSSPAEGNTNNGLLLARLKHQCLSMRLIREAMKDLGAPASDSLIENIMRVGANGANVYAAERVSSYAPSPIKEGFPQFDLYGRFEISTPHFRIMRFLVQQRGGIDTLNPSISQPLQMCVTKITT